jgi:hypothetical protein
MGESPWNYIRNQVIGDNVSFNLLPSQDVRATLSQGSIKTTVL